MTQHEPLTKEKMRMVQQRRYILADSKEDRWTPCGNPMSAVPEAMPTSTNDRRWVSQIGTDDVLSALEGLKEELTKEHLHFKDRGSIYMMDYTEQILLCVDKWFPIAQNVNEKGVLK
jgi:hypothetical protein